MSRRRPSTYRAPPSAQLELGGGTAITVQQGDTIDGLVKRYGVPASAIAEANNIPNGTALRPGQRLVIPKYEATGSTPAPRERRAAIAAPATSTSQHVHVVAPGETLMALSRQYQQAAGRDRQGQQHRAAYAGEGRRPHRHSGRARRTQAAVQAGGDGGRAAEAAPRAPKVATVPAAPAATPSAAMVTPAAHEPEPPKTKTDVTAALPTFRWPVHGRVITAFGPKPSGQQNDGINVSVPEGTPIKAAEDGVVAYAGNELKGYGNLVLVRHSNGYVTAYAHASEIMVKRDDPVKRGQIIAKAGQTGNVAAPQLHFEIRKGSTPVDPAPFLDKGGNT